MDKLCINERFKELIPHLTVDEYQQLEKNLIAEGCRDALIVWQRTIIDGHNRYKICQENDITFNITEKMFTDEDAVMLWILTNQLGRRNLTDDQRAIVVDELVERQGKVRLQEAGKKGGRGNKKDIKPSDAVAEGFIEPKTDTRRELSQKAKVSERKVRKARKLRKDHPELAEKVRQGDITLIDAERKIKEDDRNQKIETNKNIIINNHQPLPNQKFKTLVIDPPWDWGDEGDVSQFGRGNPTYNTIPIDDLLKLPIDELTEKDAHLYLWITNRSLPKGFKLIEAWGFRYVTCLTWCKPFFGMGNYYRGQTEHILFAVKGSMGLLRKDVGTCFTAERGNIHSEKPDHAYKIIESCSPGPWIEMYARKKRAGWHVWGGEV